MSMHIIARITYRSPEQDQRCHTINWVRDFTSPCSECNFIQHLTKWLPGGRKRQPLPKVMDGKNWPNKLFPVKSIALLIKRQWILYCFSLVLALLDTRFNWQCVYRRPSPEVKETQRPKRDSYLLRRGDRQPLNKFLCASRREKLRWGKGSQNKCNPLFATDCFVSILQSYV